ncbi:unnamed protein product [Prunus armeniaca]
MALPMPRDVELVSFSYPQTRLPLSTALRFKFHASNNEAEYEALLAGLRLAKEMGAEQIQIFSDSQLVVHQVNPGLHGQGHLHDSLPPTYPPPCLQLSMLIS